MKLFGLTLATVAVAQYNNTFVPAAAADALRSYGVELEAATAATCYKCEGNSYVDCIRQANLREGGAISCPKDKICSITERRRGGEIERVEMRCKNEDVCKMELEHNLRPCPQMTWVTECHQMDKDGKLISPSSIFLKSLFRKRRQGPLSLPKMLPTRRRYRLH